MSKSPSAFRTISEVAEELDVPAHVLRFWESKFAQVKPMKRGGGRRYYRPADVDLLRGIRELLYIDGLTIKGVQKVLREQGVKNVLARGGNAAEVVIEVEERKVASGGGGSSTVVSGGESRPSLTIAPIEDMDEPEIDEDAAQRARIEATIRRLTSLRDKLRATA
jgi:DNA-binding transcriptional MerR regulator